MGSGERLIDFFEERVYLWQLLEALLRGAGAAGGSSAEHGSGEAAEAGRLLEKLPAELTAMILRVAQELDPGVRN